MFCIWYNIDFKNYYALYLNFNNYKLLIWISNNMHLNVENVQTKYMVLIWKVTEYSLSILKNIGHKYKCMLIACLIAMHWKNNIISCELKLFDSKHCIDRYFQ